MLANVAVKYMSMKNTQDWMYKAELLDATVKFNMRQIADMSVSLSSTHPNQSSSEMTLILVNISKQK